MSSNDPAADPNNIELFDEFGRRIYVTRAKWGQMLVASLSKERDDPDKLYSGISGALRDGYAAELLPAALRLLELEPASARAASALGIVYLKTDELERAESVLQGFCDQHGEEGTVLTNLARVYLARGEHERAQRTLWKALEGDPNQEHALPAYAAMAHHSGGDAAVAEAYHRVAALPGSWRSRIWLAHIALRQHDLAAAMRAYEEALAIAPRPLPSEPLLQISGDLASAGHLRETLLLTEPRFDPAYHGLAVGNNLIKAHRDLGELDDARRILESLYAQKRSDWQPTLSYWDRELVQARAAHSPTDAAAPLEMIALEGPIWTLGGSPFAALLPAKQADAIRVLILGSTRLGPAPSSASAPASEEPAGNAARIVQQPDVPGRLTRALPLFLAEHLQLRTNAVAVTVIPWVGGAGFAVFDHPYGEEDLRQLARRVAPAAHYVVALVFDTTAEQWNLSIRLVDAAGQRDSAHTSLSIAPESAGAVGRSINSWVEKALLAASSALSATFAPSWYLLPEPATSMNYVFRLEQLLATAFASLKQGTLSGERSILTGMLELNLAEPKNAVYRMLLAAGLREMRKVRPDVVAEAAERVSKLQLRFPLPDSIGHLVGNEIQSALG